MDPNFNLQSKANLAAQDVIFDSFILSDFLTFGKSVSETRQLLYVLDGIAILPALLFMNKFALNGETDMFKALFDKGDSGIAVAMCFATFFYLLRPMVVCEIHMTYYRKQLSDASKYNFMSLIVFVPLISGVLIAGLASQKTNIEIPFMSGLQLLLCLLAYWHLVDIERRYVSEK